jgi:hypothetical protein
VEDSFNYVAVLVSIVIGLGVTRVLSQLSEAISSAKSTTELLGPHALDDQPFHSPHVVVVGLLSMEDCAAMEFLSLHVGNHRADAALSRLGRALPRRAGIDRRRDLARILLCEPPRLLFHSRVDLAARCHRHVAQRQTAFHRSGCALSADDGDLDDRFSYRRNHRERTLSSLLVDLLSAARDLHHDNRVAETGLGAARLLN